MQEKIQCEDLSGDLFLELEEIKQLDKEKNITEITNYISDGTTTFFTIVCC